MHSESCRGHEGSIASCGWFQARSLVLYAEVILDRDEHAARRYSGSLSSLILCMNQNQDAFTREKFRATTVVTGEDSRKEYERKPT